MGEFLLIVTVVAAIVCFVLWMVVQVAARANTVRRDIITVRRGEIPLLIAKLTDAAEQAGKMGGAQFDFAESDSRMIRFVVR